MNYEIFKNKFIRKTLSVWCAFATLVTMCSPAWAVVATGDYLGGAANLNGASSGIENYGTQSSTYAGFTAGGATGVLEWNKLNVPGGTTMEFNNGTFYNVVNSAGGMSTIAGAINGTDAANVYIFNPNGILFNAGSSVDVGGIFGALATGVSGMTLSDWMSNPTAVPAAIRNAEMTGNVTVDGGTFKAAQIALAGLNVSTAEGAKFENKTVLAAGDKVAIDGFGGGMITLTIPDAATEGDVDMLGQFADNLAAMAAGNVRAANGTLEVAGDLTVDTYGDVDVQPGAFVVNNGDVFAESITVKARGEVSVQGSSTIQATAGDLKLTAQNGAVTVVGTTTTGAKVMATGGDVVIDAGEFIDVADGQIVAEKDGSTGGNVTLSAAKTDALATDPVGIHFADTAGTTADTGIRADGDVKITAAEGWVHFDENASVDVGGDLKVTANSASAATPGSIREVTSASIVVSGNATFEAANGDVKLEGANNDFSKGGAAKVVNATAKTVTITEGVGDISLGTVKASEGAVKVTDANGTITIKTELSADGTDGNIELAGKDVTADNATVKADADMTVSGKLTQDGGTLNAKKLTLSDGADVAGAVSANALDASGKAVNAKTGADIDVTTELKAGTLDVDAGTVDAATIVATVDQDGGAVKATTSVTGDVNVDGAGSTLKTAKIDGTLEQANGTVSGATENGNLQVTKAVTQNGGTIDVGTGTLTLDKASTVKGTVNAATIANGETLTQAGGTLTANAVNGAFVQNDGTADKQSGSTLAFGSTVKQTKGTIGSAATDVSMAGKLTQDGGTVNANTLTLKGGAEQTGGQVVATVLALDNAAKDVTLTSADNDFDRVKGTVDTLKLVDKDDIDLMTITAGKGLAVQAQRVAVMNEVKTTADNGNILIEANDTATPANGKISLEAGVTAKGNLSVLASGEIKQLKELKAQDGTVDVSAGGELNMYSTAKTESTGNIGYVGNGGSVDGTLKATGAGSKAVVVGAGIGGSGSISGDEIALKVTSLGTATDRASLNASKIAIEATTGDIYVDNAKAAQITTVNLADVKVNRVQPDLTTVETSVGGGGSVNGLKAESGVIDMVNKGTLTVKADVTAGKTLALTATDAGDIVVDAVRVTSKEGATLTAANAFEAKNGAVVKAGLIDETTLTALDSKNLTIDAATAKINSGAKVAASGDATVTADSVTVNTAKLAAGGDMTIDTKAADGTGAVTIQNGAAVASKGALTIGGTSKPATLTVEGTDTKLVAAGALTANAGRITVQDNAKVASDGALSLKTTEGALVVQSGAKVLAEKKLALDAKTDMFIDNATVAGKDEVSLTAVGTVLAMNNATVKAGEIDEATPAPIDSKNLTIDAANVVINSGAKVGASGAATVIANAVTVDSAKLVAGGAMAIDMKAKDGAGAVTIQNGAVVAAKGVLTVGDTKKPATLTVDGAQLVSAEALTAKAGKITVQNNAKVASDDALSLKTTEGALVVQSGAKVLAVTKLTLEAKTDVTVDNAVVKAGTDAQWADLQILAGEGVSVVKGATVGATRDVKVTADTVGDTEAGVTIQNENTRITAGNTVTIFAYEGGLTVADKAKIDADRQVNLGAESRDVVIQGGANVQGDQWVQAIAYNGNVKLLDKAVLTGGQSGLFAFDGGNVLVDDATIASRAGTDLVAMPYNTSKGGNVTVQNGAKVKAGDFDETTYETTGAIGGIQILSAKEVTIQSASKVGANGAVAISAGTALTVQDENTQVGAKGALSLDAGRAITVQKKAVVAGETTLTVGGTTAPATLTVQGADTKLVAAGALTANAGRITAQDNAKVASDDALSLKTTEGALVVQSGAKVLAEKKLALDAKTDMFIDNATVAGKDEVSLTAVGTVLAMNNATVKAGEIDESSLTVGEAKALTIDAAEVAINSGAKVGASGAATVKADAVTVDNAKLASGSTMTIDTKTTDGTGAVTIQNGAAVASKGALTVGGTSKPATLTVQGADTKLVAAGALTANAGKITVQDNAKVASDGALTLKTTEGALVVQGDAKVLAEKKLALDAKTDMFIDNATVAGKDEVSLTAAGTVMAMNNAVGEGKSVTLDAETITVKSGAGVSASDDVKASAKYTNVNGGNLVAGKDVLVDAKTDGEGTVIFENGAVVYAKETLAVGGEKKPDRIKIGDATVSADKNIRLAAAGDTTIDSAVTAGKHLTVIGKNVRQNADFTAKNGSVYVEATGGDIVMKAGTQTTAKRTTTPNPHTGEGNVLYMATGDVRAEAGGATVVADPDNNDGAAVLTSTAGGSVGENITVKAARSGAVAEGDITMHIAGDAEVALASKSGSIALTHENGTLTISKSGIGGNDQVVRVDSVEATTMIPLSGSTPGGRNGLSAKQDVTIAGRPNSALVVNSDSGISAEQGAVTIGVDKTITVAGSVAAGTDVQMTAGQDLSVAGSATAGRDASMRAGRNVAIDGTVEARGDVAVSADRDVDVNGLVKAGHDAVVSAGRDVDVGGVIAADRTERVHAGRHTTVRGTLKAGTDLDVVAAGNLSTPGAGKLVAGRDLFVTVGSSTPQINIAVGKGVSAQSGERALAFRTVGGYDHPEVYGNDSETAVFIDGRVAGGNSADFSILQGYEQVAALGNIQLTPLFTYLANFNPLGSFVDAQAPGASFGQANMTSDKGEIVEE